MGTIPVFRKLTISISPISILFKLLAEEHQCEFGSKFDGETCSDINECEMGFCGELHCENTIGSFNCICRDGFKTVLSDYGQDFFCEDVNECDKNNTCSERSTCENLVGGFKCNCHSGFQNETCSDVDECSSGKHDCSSNADCLNSFGSYDCECRSGFFGPGQKCENYPLNIKNIKGIRTLNLISFELP